MSGYLAIRTPRWNRKGCPPSDYEYPSVVAVEKWTADAIGCDRRIFRLKSREQDIVKRKFAFYYVANRLFGVPLQVIARYCRVDHTTVSHGATRFAEDVKYSFSRLRLHEAFRDAWERQEAAKSGVYHL